MTMKNDDLLSATVENWLYRQGIQARRGSMPDIARRMLSLGVLARAETGELISQAGGSPADVLALVQDQAGHLFGRDGPEDAAAPAIAPKPPTGPKPSAGARLEAANDTFFREAGDGR